MIDNITLIKNNLTSNEKLQVIEKNNLQCFVNESNNSKIYDNAKNKNLTGGILIKIFDDKIKIEGSIHKYFNYLQFKTLENYTVFTMEDFLMTIEKLFENFSIPRLDFLVSNYEIGLNVFVGETDPIKYLQNALSVGNLDGTQRKLYINPRYKDERFLTTQMHKDNTLVFRIYDKDFERMDKGKKNKIAPCLRIETKRTRQKNISFSDFSKPSSLTILQNKFFAEWNKLNFDKEVCAPAGTHQSKKDLAKKILVDGKNIALQELEEKRQFLTPKIYRTQKDFIKNWEINKFNFSLINSQIAEFWAIYYNTAIQLVIIKPFKN
ncbi:hypothetical protein [Epilithonimonas tenax]|uniref:hypothetical protein n=1 Tax=Epilithonimonas tenax TaxID=191577 RepID=UPI0003FEFB56|nr:hypothetical protein [Epilithonimonas tenax]